MQLKECLEDETTDELDMIARNNAIHGYSNLKKDAKIDLIVKNLVNTEVLNTTLSKLRPSRVYQLKTLYKMDGEADFELIRELLLASYRSRNTFYTAYGTLQDYGLVYEFEYNDETIDCIIPKDLLEVLRAILKEKYTMEMLVKESAEDVEEAKEDERIELRSLEDILMQYAQKTEIQALLGDVKVPKSGRKAELVDRVLKVDIQKTEILEHIFSKAILQDISRDMNLPSSGTKGKLITSILGKLGVSIDPAYLATTSKKKVLNFVEPSNPQSVSTMVGKPGIKSGQLVTQEVDTSLNLENSVDKAIIDVNTQKHDIIQEIYEFMSNSQRFHLTASAINNQDILIGSISSILASSDFIRKYGVKVETPSKTNSTESKMNYPDIILRNEEQTIIVIAKYIDQKHPGQSALEVFALFSSIHYEPEYLDVPIVVFIYDKAENGRKFTPEYENKVRTMSNNLGIYKTQGDYTNN